MSKKEKFVIYLLMAIVVMSIIGLAVVAWPK
jgi:hypothetical protein